MEETNKKTICAKFEVDEEKLKRVDIGMDKYDFYDTVVAEFGWVADSGIELIELSVVDE